TVETIFERANIEEVISDFVSLKKSGANYKGCCPFHDEKTPSFMVSPAKGIFKCFGCGKGGNSVSFIMEHERMPYVDALKFLAKKYNIEIVETELSEEDKEKKSTRESLQVVNTYANTYFQKQLVETDEGKSIGLSYFQERGFTDETITKFQLGYSPQKKDAFTRAALDKGYKIEYLEQTGLTIVRESAYYDRFRARVMFPIHSLSGNVIGFGGRIMVTDTEKKLAKYLNSPESELYNKSKTLYGIYFSRSEIVKKDECILVEGYTDVMSMHQSGIENVVASSGTSLTVEQILLIKRFTTNIVIVYDGDAAGIKASFRGINMILEQGLNVKVLIMPDGEDPDSFAQKHSKEELQSYILSEKKDFIQFKTEFFAEQTKNDPVERARLIQDIVHTISVIPNQIERSVYLSESSKMLGIAEEILADQTQKLIIDRRSKEYSKQVFEKQKSTVKKQLEKAQKKGEDSYSFTERDILYLLILYGLEHVTLPTAESEIIVKDYVYHEIVDGGMEFLHDIHKELFEEYYTNIDEKQTEISKYLTHHSNQILLHLVVDMISSDKKLSDFWAKKESFVETERDKLPNLVIETVFTYKKRRIELERNKLIEKMGVEPDEEKLFLLGQQISKYNKTINDISKDLKHVS
ncbi:MAG: DNA primase, partial [Bacteroidota bacterium]